MLDAVGQPPLSSTVSLSAGQALRADRTAPLANAVVQQSRRIGRDRLSNDATDLHWGVGAQYAINPNLSAVANYERIEYVGNDFSSIVDRQRRNAGRFWLRFAERRRPLQLLDAPDIGYRPISGQQRPGCADLANSKGVVANRPRRLTPVTEPELCAAAPRSHARTSHRSVQRWRPAQSVRPRVVTFHHLAQRHQRDDGPRHIRWSRHSTGHVVTENQGKPRGGLLWVANPRHRSKSRISSKTWLLLSFRMQRSIDKKRGRSGERAPAVAKVRKGCAGLSSV